MSRLSPEEVLDILIDHLIDPDSEVKPVTVGGPWPHEANLYALVSLAERVRQVLAIPDPTQSFIRNAKLRILNRIQANKEPGLHRAESRPGRSLVRPGFGTAVAALGLAAILIFSTLGVGVAAAKEALPGESLYPLKRGFEETRLMLSLDESRDVRLLAEFSDERLREIEQLLQAGRTENLAQAAEAYTESIARLAQASGALKSREAHSVFDERAASHVERLERVKAQVPPEAQQAIQRAIDRTMEHTGEKHEQQQGATQNQRENQEQRENQAATRRADHHQTRAEHIARQYDVTADQVMNVYNGVCEGDWKCVRDYYREGPGE